MHTSISNTMERRKIISVFLYLSLALAAALLPLSYVHATSIGTNVSVTGTLTVTDTSTFTAAATFNGNVTVGNLATADTLTVTARLAADLDPNANDTIDLGAFDLAYNDVFASGTARLAGFTSAASGAVTVGTSTANTLTVTARLAADLDPSTDNQRDLGTFGLAYKDIYASSTVFAADISDLLYVDAANSRIGISSSTPSAKLSIGTANASSTLDVPQLCFRTTVDIGGTDSEVYYWPCVGAACPTGPMAAAGWATSTASCF